MLRELLADLAKDDLTWPVRKAVIRQYSKGLKVWPRVAI